MQEDERSREREHARQIQQYVNEIYSAIEQAKATQEISRMLEGIQAVGQKLINMRRQVMAG